MNVVYYLDINKELYWRLLRISMLSVRKVMPYATITFVYPDWFDDDYSASLGFDRRFIIPGLPRDTHHDFRRFLANSNIPAGDNLFLDVDTVVQQPISKVWDYPFAVAVAKRDKIMAGKPNIVYNIGVCYCRIPQFWKHVAVVMPKYTTHWDDVEGAFSTVLQSKEYHVKDLNWGHYNYTPEVAFEDCKNAYIVHYKGPRKAWMLAREKEFVTNV